MDALLESETALKRCDLLVFLYDSDQESRPYLEALQEKFSPFIPKLLIYDKSKQIGGDQVSAFAKTLDIKLFKEVSLTPEQLPLKELIDTFLLTASEPYRGISDKSLEELRSSKYADSGISTGQTLALGLIVAGAAAAALYRFIFKAAAHST